jgi:hypothetical protein
MLSAHTETGSEGESERILILYASVPVSKVAKSYDTNRTVRSRAIQTYQKPASHNIERALALLEIPVQITYTMPLHLSTFFLPLAPPPSPLLHLLLLPPPLSTLHHPQLLPPLLLQLIRPCKTTLTPHMLFVSDRDMKRSSPVLHRRIPIRKRCVLVAWWRRWETGRRRSKVRGHEG